MGSLHRERRILRAVACPACGAPAGTACRLRSAAERSTATNRLLVHAARRQAWQTWKAARPVAVAVHGTDLVAQTDAAWIAIQHHAQVEQVPGTVVAPRTLRVAPESVSIVILALTAAGYRVE